MEKKIGIWLDYQKAFLVSMEGKKVMTRIDSKVENYHLFGGAKASTPYSAQDVASEKKLRERRKHQIQDYFNAIVQLIKGADQIYIFGPAEAKIGLDKHIRNIHEFRNLRLVVESASHLTENQMTARVREFFEKEKV